jgi:hypothetical protein
LLVDAWAHPAFFRWRLEVIVGIAPSPLANKCRMS